MARTTATIALICVATAGLAAGCGGGSANKPHTLTKAQVIARGSVICKTAESRVATLHGPTTEHPFATTSPPEVQRQARQWLMGMADALAYSRTGLQKLAAPAQDKQLLDGYLRDIGTVVSELRGASTAPAPQAEAQATKAFGLFERASKQTAAYGFPKGVCGAGDSR
jgi:hypothetical protein